MTKEQREFRKAMQIGTTWVRTNHVNPRAAAPIEVTVVKRELHGVTFDNSGELKWPDMMGFDVNPDGDSWEISLGSRLILTYTPTTE